MKKILLAMSIVAVSFAANAQKNESGFHIGAGLNLALPIGTFGDTHGFGIGGQVQGEYMFDESLSGTITSGYTSFTGKDVTVGSTKISYPSVGYVPILAGIRYYAAPSFFIGAKVGYGLLTGSGSSDGAFNYQPEVGYNAEKFQVSVGYNGLSKSGDNVSHIGLTALYKFN